MNDLIKNSNVVGSTLENTLEYSVNNISKNKRIIYVTPPPFKLIFKKSFSWTRKCINYLCSWN